MTEVLSSPSLPKGVFPANLGLAVDGLIRTAEVGLCSTAPRVTFPHRSRGGVFREVEVWVSFHLSQEPERGQVPPPP